MDTDSFYMAFSTETLYDAIQKDKRLLFFEDHHNFLCAESCDEHRSTWVRAMAEGQAFEPCTACKEREDYDARQPGLFKIEFKGCV